MFDFLAGLFGKDRSSEVAKERLQLVLIHDRNDVSPEIINALRIDMINAIKKHLDIDENGIDIQLQRKDRSVALVADIPLRAAQRPNRGKKRNG
jgi:cell division topological specificity factor